MNQWARAVNEIYRKVGKWEKVAHICDGGRYTYSPATYWDIAHGRQAPTLNMKRSIIKGFREAGLGEPRWLRLRAERITISIYPDTHENALELKSALGITWDDFVRRATEALKKESASEHDLPVNYMDGL